MQQRLCTCGAAFGLSESSDQAQGERQQGTTGTALLTVLLGPCQVAVFSMRNCKISFKEKKSLLYNASEGLSAQQLRWHTTTVLTARYSPPLNS